MKADTVTLKEILAMTAQMIVPIYQREYCWQIDQVRTLWNDIICLYKENIKNSKKLTHFIGPIVRFLFDTGSMDIKKTYLVDGQQRLITLIVLLACIRNKIKDDRDKKEINVSYLINEVRKHEEKYKLIASKNDKVMLKQIIDGELNGQNNTCRLLDAFNYFTKKLKNFAKTNDQLISLKQIIVEQLIIINIDVGDAENPCLIFESLNGKGTPLKQSDLIRNYLFMELECEEENKETLFKKYWFPMEKNFLDKKQLESFFLHYFGKDGETVYNTLKKEIENNERKNSENELQQLYKYSCYYTCLINPTLKEKNHLLAEKFRRIKRLKISPIYSFLLNIYHDYENKKIECNEFYEILEFLETILIRKNFTGQLLKNDNNAFNWLYKQAKKMQGHSLVASIKQCLKSHFPDDATFLLGLMEFKGYGKSTDLCRFVLETLEDSFHHKEPVDKKNITIEHIMPQKLSPEWEKMLGEDFQDIHYKYLHTLGNLTLTGYNAELGNKPYEEKKKHLEKMSHIELNKYFKNVNKWDEDEILKRAVFLTKKALDIWKNPFHLS